MSSNANWSSKDDKILINFVRNHEAIYNIKSKEHRKTQLKQNLWREIGKILNKTDSECSKRWCYVRDYYIRRRVKPGTVSSGEAARKRAALLSFLDDLPSSQRNSVTNVFDENPRCSSNIIEDTHDNSDGQQSTNQENDDNSDDNDDRKWKNSNKKLKNNAYSDERLKLLKQIADRNSAQNELDETELFFSSMAKIVKKLPRYEQAQLRMQIGSLVGNAELHHIMNDPSRSSASSAGPSNSDYK